METVSLITAEERKNVVSVQKRLLCKGKQAWHHMAYTEWTNLSTSSNKTIVDRTPVIVLTSR
jgi:hypothetical protein